MDRRHTVSLTHSDSAPSREALAIAADFHRLEVRFFCYFIRFSLYPCLHFIQYLNAKREKDCFAVIAQQNIDFRPLRLEMLKSVFLKEPHMMLCLLIITIMRHFKARQMIAFKNEPC